MKLLWNEGWLPSRKVRGFFLEKGLAPFLWGEYENEAINADVVQW